MKDKILKRRLQAGVVTLILILTIVTIATSDLILRDGEIEETSGDLLITGNLSVSENISGSLSHVFGLSTDIGTVGSAGVWYNITMDASHVDAIGFTAADAQNVTVNNTGHYTVIFGAGIKDSAANPAATVAIAVFVNNVEVSGSYVEMTTSKQNAESWLEHTTHTEFTDGDKIQLRYISSDTTVTIDQSDTYATQGFSAFGYIQQIIV